MIDKNKIFKFNNFADARGGTELMVEGLLRNVDNDLLSKVDIVVSYPPNGYTRTEGRKSILWVHDLATDPGLYKVFNDYQSQYDYFVFVSNWQKELFVKMHNIPYEKVVVIKNCIDPQDVSMKKWENIDKIKLVYTSTPQRGLNILYDVFNVLSKKYGTDKIELNVFSSFDLYGERHKLRNNPYLDLFSELQNTKGINYYGSVKHEILLEELKSQHIWCLPSIWEETSCIALMEAMSSGCFCVHSNYGALYETAANYTSMYRFTDDKSKHAGLLFESLDFLIDSVINNSTMLTRHLTLQKIYSDSFYNWQIRKHEWEGFIKSII